MVRGIISILLSIIRQSNYKYNFNSEILLLFGFLSAKKSSHLKFLICRIINVTYVLMLMPCKFSFRSNTKYINCENIKNAPSVLDIDKFSLVEKYISIHYLRTLNESPIYPLSFMESIIDAYPDTSILCFVFCFDGSKFFSFSLFCNIMILY